MTRTGIFLALAAGTLAAGLALFSPQAHAARALVSKVEATDRITPIRPQYRVPDEPDMLFYIQRSVNSNTVVYAAHRDAAGNIDAGQPVDVFWRWFNIDGHRKPLNFVERAMAYGVGSVTRATPGHPASFQIVALPERVFFLDRDAQGHPVALVRMGDHLAKLVYVYLQVDDSGLLPDVTAMDLFGVDTHGGGALHEHIVKAENR